jgi:DNA repair exonuclease SbcCD ATPase subunit
MTNIGFIETNEVNKSDIIRNLFETFTKGSDEKSDDEEAIDDIAKSIAQNNEKEGISMAGLRSRNVAAVAEDAVIEEVVEEAAAEEVVEEPVDEPAEELAEEIVEKSDADNVVVEEAIEKSTTPTENNVDLAKSVDEVKASLVEIFGDLSTTIKSLRAEIADLKKSVESANGEINVVKNSVNEVKGNMSEFGQRIDEVEADTAVRKSGDLGGVVQEVKLNKSMWGGRFLSSADLYR